MNYIMNKIIFVHYFIYFNKINLLYSYFISFLFFFFSKYKIK